jgi:hypothetical protein
MVSADLSRDLLWQTHLTELLEQLLRWRAAVVVGSEGSDLPLERQVIPEHAVEVRPARIPRGPARIADDLIGCHGIGHGLQPKSHYR